MSIKLSTLLRHCFADADVCCQTFEDLRVTGMTLDSRQLKAGDLFVAYPGLAFDGRDFIASALTQDACAVLAEAEPDQKKITIQDQSGVPIITVPQLKRHIGKISACFYGYPAQRLTVIAVTGTNGKTSCVQFIAEALNRLKYPCGAIGTLGIGYPVGDEVQWTEAGGRTTPDVINLHKILSRFVHSGLRYVAMEVSSHAIAQRRIDEVDIDYAIFTNLSRDHLDYHQTMEGYKQAKSRLFLECAKQGVLLNLGDDLGRALVPKTPRHLSISGFQRVDELFPKQSEELSMSDHDLLWGCALPQKLPELSMRFFSNKGLTGDIHTNLLGKVNGENLLAVLALLLKLGVEWKPALNALSQLNPVLGRLQRVDRGSVTNRHTDFFGTKGHSRRPWIVVDYAHTPDGLLQVLKDLSQGCSGQLWCVFGCGGERDRGKRAEMGKIAEAHSDRVVITNDNPRREPPEQIMKDIVSGLRFPKQAVIEYDRAKAIQYAIKQAKSHDRVLIAGKGHETYQQIGEDKLPFSDAEVVRGL